MCSHSLCAHALVDDITPTQLLTKNRKKERKEKREKVVGSKHSIKNNKFGERQFKHTGSFRPSFGRWPLRWSSSIKTWAEIPGPYLEPGTVTCSCDLCVFVVTWEWEQEHPQKLTGQLAQNTQQKTDTPSQLRSQVRVSTRAPAFLSIAHIHMHTSEFSLEMYSGVAQWQSTCQAYRICKALVRSPAPYSEDLARRGGTYHQSRGRGRRLIVLGAAVVVYT